MRKRKRVWTRSDDYRSICYEAGASVLEITLQF